MTEGDRNIIHIMVTREYGDLYGIPFRDTAIFFCMEGVYGELDDIYDKASIKSYVAVAGLVAKRFDITQWSFRDKCRIIWDSVRRFSCRHSVTIEKTLFMMRDSGILERMIRCYPVLGEDSEEELDAKIEEFVDHHRRNSLTEDEYRT